MFGDIVEHQVMSRVGQERAAFFPRAKLFGVERQAAAFRDQLAEVEAPVRVEVVEHPVESPLFGMSLDHVTHMITEVHVATSLPQIANHLAGGHHERRQRHTRAMSDVIVLAFDGLARLCRLSG